MLPMHAAHDAADLAAKAPLADRLRRGAEVMRLRLEPVPADTVGVNPTATS